MCEKNSDNCIFIMLLCPQLYVAVIPYIKATKVPFSSTKKKTPQNTTLILWVRFLSFLSSERCLGKTITASGYAKEAS